MSGGSKEDARRAQASEGEGSWPSVGPAIGPRLVQRAGNPLTFLRIMNILLTLCGFCGWEGISSSISSLSPEAGSLKSYQAISFAQFSSSFRPR